MIMNHLFTVITLFRSKSERDCVFKSMYGQIKKLIRHKEAAPILEMAYNVYANSAQRFCMMEEFYGPRFALFKVTTTTTLPVLDYIIHEPPHYCIVLLYYSMFSTNVYCIVLLCTVHSVSP